MSRYKELTNAIANQNMDGGIEYKKWIMFLLTDIAVSLATIADTLTEPRGEQE